MSVVIAVLALAAWAWAELRAWWWKDVSNNQRDLAAFNFCEWGKVSARCDELAAELSALRSVAARIEP